MKKLKQKLGFTLIEMMAALLILVLMVVGMDAGMSAATRAYSDANFEAASGSLAGILNTAVGDILRYSEDVIVKTAPDRFVDADGTILDKVDFVFTNYEYGVRNAYFYTTVHADGSSSGTLQIKNLQNSTVAELVNTGSYPGLEISNFVITYHPPVPDSPEGAYFDITYDILDTEKPDRIRSIQCVVRRMNPES